MVCCSMAFSLRIVFSVQKRKFISRECVSIMNSYEAGDGFMNIIVYRISWPLYHWTIIYMCVVFVFCLLTCWEELCMCDWFLLASNTCVTMSTWWMLLCHIVRLMAHTGIITSVTILSLDRPIQQQQQPFYGPLSRTTQVSWYQKKYSPTHHPDHHPIFISFFHLLWPIISSLFKLCAWQSFCTTSIQVMQKDCQAHNLNREDAMDRSRWKKLIKIGL